MKKEKISIIVPIYNTEKHLKDCFESIINQTYKNLEIILVDDGSKDNSGKIADDYAKIDKRIKVYHKKNEGVSATRNYGINKSSGVWLAFVDSDDIIDKKFCENMINVVDDETDIVVGRVLSFANDLNNTFDDGYKGGVVDTISLLHDKEKYLKSIFIDNKKELTYAHSGMTTGKLIRKKILKENDLLFDRDLFLYEDAYLCMQLIFFANKIKTIDKPVYFYRDNLNSATHIFKESILSQFDLIYFKFTSFFQEKGLTLNKYMTYFKTKNLNMLLTIYCKSDNSKIKYVKKICESSNVLENMSKDTFKILPKKRKLLVSLLKFRLFSFVYLLYKYT